VDLTIATRDDGDATVVTLSGELDIASADGLREHLTSLLAGGHIRIVIDLAGLTFCDSTGLSTFVRASHGAVEHGGYLRLAAPNTHVARVLSIVGLLDLFPTYQTVDGARQADVAALVPPAAAG
jgi:anti-sigma B factor antagonist